MPEVRAALYLAADRSHARLLAGSKTFLFERDESSTDEWKIGSVEEEVWKDETEASLVLEWCANEHGGTIEEITLEAAEPDSSHLPDLPAASNLDGSETRILFGAHHLVTRDGEEQPIRETYKTVDDARIAFHRFAKSGRRLAPRTVVGTPERLFALTEAGFENGKIRLDPGPITVNRQTFVRRVPRYDENGNIVASDEYVLDRDLEEIREEERARQRQAQARATAERFAMDARWSKHGKAVSDSATRLEYSDGYYRTQARAGR